jgi:hypothetical protein
VIPIVLVLGGTLFASGLALYAIREREWTLAFFMGLIVLLALAAAYVAFDCLGEQCLFDGGAHSEAIQTRVDSDA